MKIFCSVFFLILHNLALGESLDTGWKLSVGSQTVNADDNGGFLISNVTAPDQFGEDGSGSSPDYLSDDFVRLIGYNVTNGIRRYVWSQPFQIRGVNPLVPSKDAGSFLLSDQDLTFSDTPLVKPEFIRITAPNTLLHTIGETVQLTTTAIFSGTASDISKHPAVDVTPRSQFTVYRSSNPGILTVAKDGLATARGNGAAIVSAVNSMVSASLAITVDNTIPTTVEGIVRNPDQSPVVGAFVTTEGKTGTTDAHGHFQITNVPSAGGGTIEISVNDGAAVIRIAAVPGGITDTGNIVLGTNTADANEYIVLFETNFDESTPTLKDPRELPSRPAEVQTLVTIATTPAFGTIESPSLTNPITFQIPAIPAGIQPKFIPFAGQSISFDLMISSNDIIENKGILVSANSPFQLFGASYKEFNQFYGSLQPGSGEGYKAIPVQSLGAQYRVMSYPTTSKTVGVRASQFAIAGVRDKTIVTITTTADAGSRKAGIPYKITLNRLQTYQLKAEGVDDDLTGTLIVADKPIAVFAGHECTATSPIKIAPDSPDGGNFLIEQMPAIETWGNSFITTALGFKGHLIRILANEDNTVVKVRGASTADVSLKAGHFTEVRDAGVDVITATKSILVAQYTPGQYGDGAAVMSLVTPTTQYLNSYQFAISSDNGFAAVAIVAKTTDVQGGKMILNGEVIPNNQTNAFVPIPNSEFSVSHQYTEVNLNKISSSQPFGICIYNQGFWNGFAYPGTIGGGTSP